MTVNLRRRRHVSYVLEIITVDFVTLSHDLISCNMAKFSVCLWVQTIESVVVMFCIAT